MSNIHEVFDNTDWKELAQQKLVLLETITDFELAVEVEAKRGNPIASERMQDQVDGLYGILHWIDAIQDACEKDGHPVVFLTEEENA